MTKKKPHPKRNPLLLYARAHTAEREREREKKGGGVVEIIIAALARLF